MTPAEFRDRLETAARQTGLNASDIAFWLNHPRPTVRAWLLGTKPSGWINKQVWERLEQRLIWLERLNTPPTYTSWQRRDWLRVKLADEHLRSVRQGVGQSPAADFSF